MKNELNLEQEVVLMQLLTAIFMEEITLQVRDLRVSLTETQLALEYQTDLTREIDLILKHRSLLFIARVLNEYLIMKTSAIIETKEKLHILKPINKVLSDKTLQNGLDERKIEKINEIKGKIEFLINGDIKQQINYIRDKYLAHNDFGDRESIQIDFKKISTLLDNLVIQFNAFTELIGMGKISEKPLAVNSISDIIKVLKNCQ